MKIFDWLFGRSQPKEISREFEYHTGEKLTVVTYDDGSALAEMVPDEPFTTFYKLSEDIRTSRDISTKLAACEASYKILPEFVRLTLADWGKLPDSIRCRDEGAKLYMRLGDWSAARSAIDKCIAAGAYPDGGAEALNHLARYEQAARLALAFLDKSSGFPQNKIYKALPAADQDCLKEFVRSSLLIRKEKFGRTNKLYRIV